LLVVTRFPRVTAQAGSLQPPSATPITQITYEIRESDRPVKAPTAAGSRAEPVAAMHSRSFCNRTYLANQVHAPSNMEEHREQRVHGHGESEADAVDKQGTRMRNCGGRATVWPSCFAQK